MKVFKSKPENHSILSEIAKSSKNFWNYPVEWMQFWDEELTITENYIKTNEVFHLENDGEIIGFYSYFPEDDKVRLDCMFVKPEWIGKGAGKILMNDFLKRSLATGYNDVILEADPNAEDFYKKWGFKTVSQKPSEIKGRTLPVMTKKL